jgi:hypothetical protein
MTDTVRINCHSYHAEQKEKQKKRWKGKKCMLTYILGKKKEKEKILLNKKHKKLIQIIPQLQF